MPKTELPKDFWSSTVETFFSRAFSQLVKKPPVPQAKSAMRSPIWGRIICAIKSVTARGV